MRTDSELYCIRRFSTEARPVPYYNRTVEAWIWIEMKPGDDVTFTGGGPDEEGYSHWEDRIIYDEDTMVVSMYSAMDARDCDGRITSASSYALIGSRWQETACSRRDHSAEAAGY